MFQIAVSEQLRSVVHGLVPATRLETSVAPLVKKLKPVDKTTKQLHKQIQEQKQELNLLKEDIFKINEKEQLQEELTGKISQKKEECDVLFAGKNILVS